MPRFNVDKEQKVNTIMKFDESEVVPVDMFSKGVIPVQNQEQTVEQVVYDKLAEGSNFNVKPQMTKQEAAQKLSELVQEVYAKLQEAQALADEHGLCFGLDVEYGMGGYYEEGEWHASSQSC